MHQSPWLHLGAATVADRAFLMWGPDCCCSRLQLFHASRLTSLPPLLYDISGVAVLKLTSALSLPCSESFTGPPKILKVNPNTSKWRSRSFQIQLPPLPPASPRAIPRTHPELGQPEMSMVLGSHPALSSLLAFASAELHPCSECCQTNAQGISSSISAFWEAL